MQKETINIVKDILREQLSINKVDVNSLIDNLGADSLDFLEIIMETEEKFNIKISDEELSTIKTVRDLIECVESKNGVTK